MMKNNLYKGLFWIENLDNIDSNDTIFRLNCDKDGNLIGENPYGIDVLGKSGDTLNHKKLWNTLPSSVTNNKDFDYYPRGRVEIHNGKAKVFITQYLVNYQDQILHFVKDKFNLTVDNGIKECNIFIDGSEHYRPKMC